MSGKTTLLKIIFVVSMVGAIALAAMLPGAAKAFVNSDEAGFFARLIGRPELAASAVVEATSVEVVSAEALPSLDETPEATQEVPQPTEEPTAEPTGEPTGESSDDGEFELVGTLFAMGEEAWDVSGITVVISATTEMTGTFDVGMLVKVEGELQEDGSVLASEIKPALNGADPENNGNPDPGNPHDGDGESELVGTLTAMDGMSWLLNGLIVVTLDENTEVEDELAVGQMVKVEGELQPDGSILAHEIKRFAYQSMNGKTAFGESELYGTLDEMTSDTSWIVSGFVVLLDEQTEQEGTFEPGVFVKVEGMLQADGSILAREVKVVDESGDSDDESEEQSKEKKSKFKGVLDEIIDDNTWVVSGITVILNEDTEVKGTPQVGMTVKVEGFVQEDGSVIAEEIKLSSQDGQPGDDDQDDDERSNSNRDDDDSDDDDSDEDEDHSGGRSGGGRGGEEDDDD